VKVFKRLRISENLPKEEEEIIEIESIRLEESCGISAIDVQHEGFEERAHSCTIDIRAESHALRLADSSLDAPRSNIFYIDLELFHDIFYHL
jgi:hypothetical protein